MIFAILISVFAHAAPQPAVVCSSILRAATEVSDPVRVKSATDEGLPPELFAKDAPTRFRDIVRDLDNPGFVNRNVVVFLDGPLRPAQFTMNFVENLRLQTRAVEDLVAPWHFGRRWQLRTQGDTKIEDEVVHMLNNLETNDGHVQHIYRDFVVTLFQWESQNTLRIDPIAQTFLDAPPMSVVLARRIRQYAGKPKVNGTPSRRLVMKLDLIGKPWTKELVLIVRTKSIIESF
jgi:hypothetical protein